MNDITKPMMVDVFKQISSLPFADLHFRNDPSTQLKAIVAIHSTELGPALGGVRCLSYSNTDRALKDVLQLARGMTYKSAINRLEYGGGKAVILYPEMFKKKSAEYRNALFSAFGDFIESLNGQYITAVDSGTGPDDMDVIARRTNHVVCTSQQMKGTGDPSPYTAQGVLRGIQAVLKKSTGSDNLSGRHILVQGVGHVGASLVEKLNKQGAKITISDSDNTLLKKYVEKFSCDAVSSNNVFEVECDVFSPCALGQVIDSKVVSKLKAPAIAGAANNQLMSDEMGEMLRKAGILYAPDYVINSGGMLQIAFINDVGKIAEKIDQIYMTLLNIFEKSDQQKMATNRVADRMAEAVIEQHYHCKHASAYPPEQGVNSNC